MEPALEPSGGMRMARWSWRGRWCGPAVDMEMMEVVEMGWKEVQRWPSGDDLGPVYMMEVDSLDGSGSGRGNG